MLTITLKVTGLFNFNNVKLTWGGRTGRKWARSLASWLESRAPILLSPRMVRASFFSLHKPRIQMRPSARIFPYILYFRTGERERKKVQWPARRNYFQPARFAGNSCVCVCIITALHAMWLCSEISSVSQSVLRGRYFPGAGASNAAIVFTFVRNSLTLEWKMWSKKRLVCWETEDHPRTAKGADDFSPAGDNFQRTHTTHFEPWTSWRRVLVR